jgi:hypothetical protein
VKLLRSAWGLIAGLWGAFLFASIGVMLFQGIVGAITVSKEHFVLPADWKAIANGVILAGFISIPLMFVIFSIVFLITSLGRTRDKPSAIAKCVGVMVVGLVQGGILIFAIPLWIAGLALLFASSYVFFGMRD